ncbi:MAG: lytic transglycosylase domain-containing protein [Armatimonadetes bacterium]|nr:lytic transglycosylase domain-containing protein [Armatimonadota bacterium]
MGSVKAELLDCAPERDIEKYDPKPPKTAKSGKNPLNGPIGQSPKSKQEAANWNLPASDAAPYYASFIRSQNKKVSEAEAMRIAQGIIGFSLKFGVDARLIMAMVLCESNFNSREVSHTGATGLGQLMPGTAAGLGVTDSFNIEQNLYGTVKLIRGHIDKYSQTTDGDYDKLILSLAAYNAGGGAVRKYGGVPPYRETQNYVRKVMAWYNALCGR